MVCALNLLALDNFLLSSMPPKLPNLQTISFAWLRNYVGPVREFRVRLAFRQNLPKSQACLQKHRILAVRPGVLAAQAHGSIFPARLTRFRPSVLSQPTVQHNYESSLSRRNALLIKEGFKRMVHKVGQFNSENISHHLGSRQSMRSKMYFQCTGQFMDQGNLDAELGKKDDVLPSF